MNLIEIKDLSKFFPVSRKIFARKSYVHAVDEVSLGIKKGEVFGLVGESGCGKTTTGKLLVRLMDPTGGAILFDGKNVSGLKGKKLMNFRKHVQMIFQDPYESLNPRFTVHGSVKEPLDIQRIGDREEREERIDSALREVGLTPPEAYYGRFPHELSGGQRQRLSIARAMVTNPDFIVADEPTSMLDVSIRAGIMNLMLKLRKELSLTCLFVTHDLAAARYMCDKIAVMYLGKLVEIAETEELIGSPLHPYTRALLSAVPVPDPTFERKRIKITGHVSTPIDPKEECRFLPRCPCSRDVCKERQPDLKEVRAGHWVACHFPER
jgi:oligopeptide/dipeptide ABC transporter, ATP-binding protein, C-terminal domain